MVKHLWYMDSFQCLTSHNHSVLHKPTISVMQVSFRFLEHIVMQTWLLTFLLTHFTRRPKVSIWATVVQLPLLKDAWDWRSMGVHSKKCFFVSVKLLMLGQRGCKGLIRSWTAGWVHLTQLLVHSFSYSSVVELSGSISGGQRFAGSI